MVEVSLMGLRSCYCRLSQLARARYFRHIKVSTMTASIPPRLPKPTLSDSTGPAIWAV